MSAKEVRIVGKRISLTGNPVEIYRFNVKAAPTAKVQRFAFGQWRDYIEHEAPTVETCKGLVARGLLVDLPVESFASLDAGIAQVEKYQISYTNDVLKAVEPVSRGEVSAWESVIATSPMHLVTLTRFTLGSCSWWVVEKGILFPVSDRPALAGQIGSELQASIFEVRSAASKVFVRFLTDMARNGEYGIFYPATPSGIPFGAITNARLAQVIASDWREFAEERKREAAAMAAAKQQVRSGQIGQPSEAAGGGVVELDDRSLAAKLRAKRQKLGS